MTKAWATLAGTVALSLTIAAQQDSHDYWGSQREMIRRGQQAIMMCNGLFTSNRTLEQIYSQELKFLARADRLCGGRRLRRGSHPAGGCRWQGRIGARHARGVPGRDRLRHPRAGPDVRRHRQASVAHARRAVRRSGRDGRGLTAISSRRRRCRRMSMRRRFRPHQTGPSTVPHPSRSRSVSSSSRATRSFTSGTRRAWTWRHGRGRGRRRRAWRRR